MFVVVSYPARTCKMLVMSLDHIPQRIVSLQPSVTSILAAIGELDRLVACTKYCVDVCPEIATRNVAIVKDSWSVTTDEILGPHPDLVIGSVPYQEKTVSAILKAGVRFLGFASRTLSDIYTDIATISGVMGGSEHGERLINQMQQEIESVRMKTRVRARVKVFCEEWGKPLIASQPWVAQLVEAAGGEFIGSPGATTSAEAVLSADPDVVVAAWCGAGDRVPLKKIVRDRNWSEMQAVREGRVYCVRDEFLNTPGPTLLLGLFALAAAIQPQDFPQVPGLRCITTLPVQTGLSTE